MQKWSNTDSVNEQYESCFLHYYYLLFTIYYLLEVLRFQIFEYLSRFLILNPGQVCSTEIYVLELFDLQIQLLVNIISQKFVYFVS